MLKATDSEAKDRTIAGAADDSTESGTAERMPVECFHVSEFVREEMDEREWLIDDLAGRMCADKDDPKEYGINRLALDFMLMRDPRLNLGDAMANALSRAFDVSPEFFINLDHAWRKWRTQQDVARDAQALKARRWEKFCEWMTAGVVSLNSGAYPTSLSNLIAAIDRDPPIPVSIPTAQPVDGDGPSSGASDIEEGS